MKWLAAALAVAVLLLQYRVWFSEDGVREVARLKQAVARQQTENGQLTDRNRQLAAEVRDLKTGMDALEERARSDLGMIARNETFYQADPDRPGALGAPRCATGSSCPPRAPGSASVPRFPSNTLRSRAVPSSSGRS